MDVDLLRPGTVPIPPGTILWFEFLLNPNLLKNHLSKPSPDPSATDLIIKFSSIAPEPQPPEVTKPIDLDDPESPELSIVESEKYTKKHLALKILCLKVAAHLKWNLNILETKLPRTIQSQLMQDLIYMATDGGHSVPPMEVSNDMLKRGGVLFSMVLYHRWLLRFLVNRALMARQPKQAYMNMGVMAAEAGFIPMHPNFERLVCPSEDTRTQSLNFLTQITLTWSDKCPKIIKIPFPDTFATLNEDTIDMDHNWESYQLAITEDEMLMQIHYDLCSNHFFYGQYDLAKEHIVYCNQSKEKLKTHVKFWGGFGTSDYASVTEEEIEGFMKALNVSRAEKGLLQKLEDAVADGYEGLLEVLEADNLGREISLVHRHVVELDIQAASTSGTITVSRDLLNKVASLNVVRSVLEGNLPSTHVDFNQRMNLASHKFVDTLLWAFTPILTSNNLTFEDKTKIKHFFMHLATSEHKIPINLINTHLAAVKIQGSNEVYKLFDDLELTDLISDLNDIDPVIPQELLSIDWECPDFNAKSAKDVEARCLRQLIDAMTADRIRDCLVKLAATNPSQSLWLANPQWKLAIPLQSVVMSLPSGFLKDFSFVLLGKAKQFGETGDYAAALELLLILETEMRNQLSQLPVGSSVNNHAVIYKLCKLVGWEVLLTQVTQVLSDWPNHKTNMSTLLKNCNSCILAVQSGDSVIPRLEIVEQSCLCLLNGGEWEKIVNNAGWASGAATAAAAAAQACHHLIGLKPHKKLPKDLWDMVLPIFATNYSGPTKRSNSGQPMYSGGNNNSRNNQDQQSAGNTKMRDGMLSFFSKLREPTVLNVVISLLARLFNILKDDSNMDLNMEYVSLWPSLVGNTNSYSLKSVSETLHQLVMQALKYYPNNISWIKLLGDMSMVGGHYSTSMKHYLSALTIMSDHFVRPLSKQLVEDQTIFKRMIKCCNHLNCPTQAAILCQFLDETDYVLAFKCLSDTSHLCSDAMDSYYGCIWDTSILEYLINLHHKRGETHRKQLAVKVMGMLELNSNNNEEIQREAANSRKAKFMRALVRQYVC